MFIILSSAHSLAYTMSYTMSYTLSYIIIWAVLGLAIRVAANEISVYRHRVAASMTGASKAVTVLSSDYSDGQITNQITVPKHTSFDKKI